MTLIVSMLTFYNSLSKKKEPFKPIDPPNVKIYNCGPTVYNFPHIGNLRRFLCADLLKRYLEYKGFVVRDVMNITDVGHMTDDESIDSFGEDKVEKSSREQKKHPLEIAKFYEDAFFHDMKELRVKLPSKIIKATDAIPEMIELIKKLLDKKAAYETPDGIYFETKKFPEYGKLSGNTLDTLQELKNINRDDLETSKHKKSQIDFALWLKCVGRFKNHILRWNSPWQEGFPGWHIECSAMAMKFHGETLDIHTGGVDNKFPHHENEIAQSESVTQRPFSNFWLHNEHLKINDEKMSKSKKNFYILKDITSKGYLPLHFRLLVLSSHYRSRLNFTWDAMKQAKENCDKLNNFYNELVRLLKIEEPTLPSKRDSSDVFNLFSYKERFTKALDDDLNSPLALKTLFDLMRDFYKRENEGKIISQDRVEIIKILREWDRIFAILNKTSYKEIPEEIQTLVLKRDELRRMKRFNEADELRKKIEGQGFSIRDEDGQSYIAAS